MKAHVHILRDILLSHLPDLAFISEPQMFQSDIQQHLSYVQHEYCYWLNSDDSIDPSLPFSKSRASGGTLGLWRKALDPHISVHPTLSSSFLPMVLRIPGTRTSIHIAIYLPTHGKDPEFTSELASLGNSIEELSSLHDNPIFFIRGDGNCNPKNVKRYELLNYFMRKYSFHQAHIDHPTYHHFVGNGRFDSNIDILLYSEGDIVKESVIEIICRNEYQEISSHHDIILSEFVLPSQPIVSNLPTHIPAPRISKERFKVLWSTEGTETYRNIVGPQLKALRQSWLNPKSKSSTSVLLQATNEVLNIAAKTSNQIQSLNTQVEIKPKKVPVIIRRTKRKLSKIKTQNQMSSKRASKAKTAKADYMQAVRTTRLKESFARDNKLSSILLENPAKVYKYIKSVKKTKSSKIEKLIVGEKEFVGSAVPDGFYYSMTCLKSCNIEDLKNDPNFSEQLSNYEHILKICQDNHNVPPLSTKTATSILSRLKKHVVDFFGITAIHYTNAGDEGIEHFRCLLNSIVYEVNNATLEELNLAYGLILYKGHNKDKNSARAYRTISTCPFLAKCLDLYLRDLYQELWNEKTAPTQYQAAGSSHELASLLVTEVIQYSLYVADQPVYFLVLDALSAYDRCLRQLLCCELFETGMTGSALLLVDNRLESRSTVYQWENEMLGPAPDITGFEQGGINSGDFYKTYNNKQLKTAQSSLLGVNISSSTVSAAGFADDVLLSSNNIYNLKLLAQLTEDYCARFRVKLVPSKTKLLPIYSKNHHELVRYAELVNPVTIDGVTVNFVSEAEHVGVLRSSSGNLANILHRISAHKKALGAVSSAGLARGHRGNPAASLKVHQLYATPVLLSGLASLVLNKAEVKILESHFKITLQNLQRLHQNTPRAAVYFLAGSFPFEAILHSRQMSLFSMICNMPDDPLYHHAVYTLKEAKPSAKSWFFQIRDICQQYGLPTPLELLQSPPPKEKLKKKVKLQILDYWQTLLRAETTALTSLRYLRPQFYSLLKPHQIWSSSASNPYEVSKSTIVARMASGRYRTEALCRFWSDNRNGFCLAPTCNQVAGDLEHLLIVCPALQQTRTSLQQMLLDRSVQYPALHSTIKQVLYQHQLSKSSSL